ncbi:C69 family dipeptidase [Allofustis seminis]|uniref:C69 family dipeptidase n=1 Tax=Allofustis seminis TaxID=166939 RepID=UPI00037180FC|nr:C69 family dipeptidase [Allofustis seminis]
MCFSVIVGKHATKNNAVILGANDDWPGCPGQVHIKKRQTYDESDKFLTVKGVEIPQVKETYAYTYTVCDYETGTRNLSWADGINENQVAVGMMGVYTFKNFQTEKDILECDDLSILALERGKTARQTVEMLGALIDEYGFSTSSIEGSEGVATIAIADPNEGFFFECAPGGYWIAKRVKDNEVECRPNCFGTLEVDFEDKETFVYSDKLLDFLKENNLWSEGLKFNFAEYFGEGPLISEAFGGANRKVNAMRRFNCVYRLCGLDHDPSLKVYSGIAKEKVSVLDIMNILRDTFEGTEYDLSKCDEAGEHNNPLWMETSYSIGQGGTVFSMVFELSTKHDNACMWVASASSKLSCFIPFFVNQDSVQEHYTKAKMGDFDLDSAWWAFQEVGQVCFRNYELIAKDLVMPTFLNYQKEMIKEKDELLVTLEGKTKEESRKYLQDFSDTCATKTYEEALKLGKYIKGKFLSNTVLTWL